MERWETKWIVLFYQGNVQYQTAFKSKDKICAESNRNKCTWYVRAKGPSQRSYTSGARWEPPRSCASQLCHEWQPKKQNMSTFQEAPPPILGIPSLLSTTWEHEPQLAQGASSDDDLNILIEAHPRSPTYVATYVTVYSPMIPELLPALVFIIKMAIGALRCPRLPWLQVNDVFACQYLEQQKSEWWRQRETGRDLTGHMVGQERKTCPSSQYFLILDDECGFNRTASLATLKSYSYSELDYAGNEICNQFACWL